MLNKLTELIELAQHVEDVANTLKVLATNILTDLQQKDPPQNKIFIIRKKFQEGKPISKKQFLQLVGLEPL